MLIFLLSFSAMLIISCIYITHTHMYLLELQSMKGYKALRHRFPFCGIESFFNSFSLYQGTLAYTYALFSLSLSLSLSLCVVTLSPVVSFFLFLALSFSLLLFAVSVFAITLWKKKDGSCTQYEKELKIEAFGGTHISVSNKT